MHLNHWLHRLEKLVGNKYLKLFFVFSLALKASSPLDSFLFEFLVNLSNPLRVFLYGTGTGDRFPSDVIPLLEGNEAVGPPDPQG